MTQAVAIETRSAALGRLVLDAARPDHGHRVLEIACGDGVTTLHAARRVGSRGLALGVDESRSMIERARRRAAEAGLANVGFLHADARTQTFAPLRFDIVLSRFGLMRCRSEHARFSNLTSALRPGGRIVFAGLDDPDRVGQDLARAGLAQSSAMPTEVDGAPVWIITARTSAGE
jgi:ubiquinone/menaquinone biosynthesis C-methylase UbiE